ncbi:protein of unknown function [Ralstonia solanacearum CMR15]|nr:protein of unknown function [Ralstonia solanacearum CMR15]
MKTEKHFRTEHAGSPIALNSSV